MLLRAPYEDNDFGATISSSMVAERKSGHGSVSYVVPDDATVDILSTIWMRFGLVPKRWFVRHVQNFEVGRWIQHEDYTLAPTFMGSHWRRR